MIKPIDMQVIVKNVDRVIETQTNQSRNLLAQQVNAKKQVEKEVEQNMTIIKEGKKAREKNIEKNQQEKVKVMRKSGKREKGKEDEHEHEEELKKRKGKDRNKGKLIDLEG